MKNNQSGIAHIAAIVAVLAIVGIGLVGWKVWSSNSDPIENKVVTNKSTQTKKTVQDQRVPDGYNLYENKNEGISLGYLKKWTVNQVEPPSTASKGFVVFASSDYQKGPQPIGGEAVLKGALVSVNTEQPRGTDVQEDYKDPKFGIDVTNFTIDGHKAVRYYLAYEGVVYSHAVVYLNNKQYNFFIHYPQNDFEEFATVRKSYEPIFLQMLESVRFN